MRTREEILRSATRTPDGSPADLKLEVLLDIRDLLVKRDDEAARCGHGAVGLCMECVIHYDLLRPR